MLHVVSSDTVNKKADILITFLKLVALMLILLCLGYMAYIYSISFFDKWFNRDNELIMPNLKKLNLKEAKALLKSKGLRFEISGKRSSDIIPKDHIIMQSVRPGMKIKKTRIIKLIVSTGPELVKVPDLRNEHLRAVRLKLKNAGFLLDDSKISYIYSQEVQKNFVIAQNPMAGVKMPRGSKIALLLSKGEKPNYVFVPDLYGKSIIEAKNLLNKNGLILGKISYVINKEFPFDIVIKQFPRYGMKVPKDSKVDIVINGNRARTLELELKQLKKIFFNYKLPLSDKTELKIKVMLKDDIGEREIYSKFHKPGEVIEFPVTGAGRMEITIFENNKKLEKIIY